MAVTERIHFADINKVVILIRKINNYMKKITLCSIMMIFLYSIYTSSNATTINNARWDLHFENIEIVNGSVNAIQEPTIIGSSNSEIVYSVNLTTPGEFYEFTVDVVNRGNLDAMVNEVNNHKLTAEQEKYLSYKATYIDGTEVNINDLLKAGSTDKLRIRLEFKKDITADDLPKEDTTIFLSLNACYVQADTNSAERENGRSN